MAQTIPEELTKLYHIIADEACQTEHRWMLLGGIIVSDEHVGHVRAKFRAMKNHFGVHGEIKWLRTDKKLVERYKRLATVAFALIERGIIQFHSMAICMDVVDDAKYNEGIPDLGYSRFFHHLLMKFCRLYPRKSKYFVKLDKRTSKIPLRPFQDAANFAAKRDYGLDHWPFRRLQMEDSKSDILFEINDLLLGAIAFEINAKHKVEPTCRSPKAELAKHIRGLSPARSFRSGTGKANTVFTIWRLRFDGRKGKEAFRNRKKFKRRHQAGQGRARKPKRP